MIDTYFKVGIDVGSTTSKLVIVDTENELAFKNYARHKTKIYPSILEPLENFRKSLGNIKVSMTITGSAGMGIAEKTGIDFIQEVISSTEVVKKNYPEIKTLIDIGGEDSKMIFFNKNKPPDIRMNGSCAGGTGAFIDQMASLMNVHVTELNTLAENHTTIYPIASRCGVFAKTDIQNLISRKIKHEDIAASIFHAVSIQALNTLARGYDVVPKVMLIGGPFTFLPFLRKIFLQNMKMSASELIVPDFSELFPAYGAALVQNGKSKIMHLDQILEKLTKSSNQSINPSNRLEPLFKSNTEFNFWNENRFNKKIKTIDFDKYNDKEIFIGIDSGSTTTKIVAIGTNREILFTSYTSNNGQPINTVISGLNKLANKIHESNKKLKICRIGVTGYGEDLIKTALSCDFGIVETIAHYTAAKFLTPEVSFIMDIGGQDMKAIFIQNGTINRLELNESCSSGCGSFIESFSKSLGYEISNFAEIACQASAPCDLGTRCTVFMNSKVKQALRENAFTKDISAGLSYSVIKNALYKVLKLRDLNELGENIVVQGGTFRNPSIQRALEIFTGKNVICSEIPELMGAFGVALLAQTSYANQTQVSAFIGLDNLKSLENINTKKMICKGCENFCTISKFDFNNNNTFYSGNKCEKHFSNKGANYVKGVNLIETKNRLLFDRNPKPKNPISLKIGIPRVLNFYHNYPFWNTLFTECGIEVVLSDNSTMNIYEKGTGGIMSDNICFPAKLVHGHILNLVEKKVDRIFYPFIIYEKNDFKQTENSFNCPIVSSYPDVIGSSMNPTKKIHIPMDSPVFSFAEINLLKYKCYKYLKEFNISSKIFKKAFNKALIQQSNYEDILRKKANELIIKAKDGNSLLIVLAGRPYHGDSLINHKTADLLASLGVDIIPENALPTDLDIYNIQIISQWAYPNKILNAAQWVSKQPPNIQFVQLNSFGCGPDAILVDECAEILKSAGKTHTVIRVDEITSTGSVHLRLRSLIESLKLKNKISEKQGNRRKTTKNFEYEDKHRTILAPYFADMYSDVVPALFKAGGYKLENLPKPDKESVDWGLKYANNEICYPATIVVGDIIKAVKSGKYDRTKIAAGITQTGGQCRATTYLSLIKKALTAAGYDDIPVISVGISGKTINRQPGFQINWLKLIPITLASMLFIDCISRMYYSIAVREKNTGDTLKLRQKYIDLVNQYIEIKNVNGVFALLKKAIIEFNNIDIYQKQYMQIGIVGEIYVKFNTFGHKFVSDWLIEQGVEVIFPPILEFFIQDFVNIRINNREKLQTSSFKTNVFLYVFEKFTNLYIRRTNRIMKKFNYFKPFHNIWEIAKNAQGITNLVNQFGEGWLIPAEIATFAKEGINNVISVQPFGCIANQIISKGIEKRIKEKYPDMNLLFLDFDDGTSEVNVLNRLYFMIKNNFQNENIN